MHKSNKRALFYALIVVFLSFFGVGCAAKRPAPKTPVTPTQTSAEAALEAKLRGTTTPEKKAKVTRPKSALEIECEKYSDPHDQAVCFKAQSLELAKRSATAKKTASANEPNSMKEVRKQEQSEQKRQADVQKRINEVYSFARITGCPAGTVIVSDTAVPPAWKRRWFVNITLDITNVGALPVNEIRAGNYGLIVQNLCSGGSLSVNFTMDVEGPDTKEIALTATSRPEDGGVSMAETRIYLNRYDMQSRQHRNEPWRINLQRQYQSR